MYSRLTRLSNRRFVCFFCGIQRKVKNQRELSLYTKHSLQSLVEFCSKFIQRFTSFEYQMVENIHEVS